MPLSKPLFQVIAEHTILTPSRSEALARINPERIYVENVRSVLGGTSWMARLICETAVRRGIFKKYVQILCPDGGVADTLAADKPLPLTVPCWREIDGEQERVVEPVDRLDKIEFYTFVRGVA